MIAQCSVTGLKAKWALTYNDDKVLYFSSARLLMRHINDEAGTAIRPGRLYETRSLAELQTIGASSIKNLKTGSVIY